MSRSIRTVYALGWRLTRTTTVVATLLVATMIEVGLRAYVASGGAVGMASVDPLLLNPAVAALEGRISNLATAGAFVEWKMGTFLFLGCALWAALTATRLTRLSEDNGTWEHLAIGQRSRSRVLTVATLVLAMNGLIVGVVALAELVISGQSWTPSLLFTASVVGASWTGAALGLVAAQVVAPRRVASQVAASAVAVMALVRIMADASLSTEWWRAFTFFGWIEDLGAFDHPHPSALVPVLLVPVALTVVAAGLQVRRDVGQALWVHGDVRKPARLLLRTPLTFALRERRTNWQVWTAGVVVLSFTIGYLTHALITLAGSDPGFVKLLNHWGMTAMVRGVGFVAETGVDFALLFSIFVVSWVTSMAEDEVQGRLDVPLAVGTKRRTWLLGVVSTATVATVVTASAATLVLWAGVRVSGSSLGLGTVAESMGNSLALVPFVLGLAVVLVAWFPRGAFPLATALLGLTFILSLLGPVLHWPNLLLAVSPFHYERVVPVVRPDYGGLGYLTALGVLGLVMGGRHFARRDLVG